MPKFTGETVEQAIEQGLSTLKITKDKTKITILETEKKGFLGFGKKEAVIVMDVIESEDLTTNTQVEEKMLKPTTKVKSVVSETKHELVDLTDEEALTTLAAYLTDITRDLGTPSIVTVSKEKGIFTFDLETEKKGLLIGKHGKLLNAIQYLSQVYIHRIAKNRLSVVVNVGDYREKREAIIARLTNQTLKKVKETGQPVFLEPMPSFERKQIHSILASEKDISTHSEGNEPHRYLVVELKK